MVLKFEEYINEGLWSKGLERAQSGEKRNEDKFNEVDLEELKTDMVREFVENYNLPETLDTYFDEIDDTYQKPIADYAKKYGTYTLGFDKDSKSVLPDFDYKFNIEDLKDVMIHITYDNQKREFKVMCGNNKDEFDITNTKLGDYLIGCITHTQLEVMQEDPELVITGMEKDWDIFSKELYDFYYKGFKNNYKNSFSNMIEDIYPGNNDVLKKFYLVAVTYRYDNPKIVVAEDESMDDRRICVQIIDVLKKAYKDATDSNEGLWSKGLERAQTGDVRQEDKIVSNIEQLQPIDLHDKLNLHFADDILVYNNKDTFTKKELDDIQDVFLSEYNETGKNRWYVPHEMDIKDMLKIKSIKYSEDENGNLVITNKRTKTEFKTNGKIFWCNSMGNPKVWYYNSGTLEICYPTYLIKEEASILLYI